MVHYKQIKPFIVVVLDGFGYREDKKGNAVAQAHMPHYHYLVDNYPHFLLHASGRAVGLPESVVGNSEVGHLTLGSGRIIEQPLLRINNAITDKSFFKNPVLLKNLELLKRRKGRLHCMGLVSDGNVHSTLHHLYAYLEAAHTYGIKEVFIHAFLDGRDVAPYSAATILEQVQKKLSENKWGVFGSLHGRFYAMDRDNNWQRTYQTYKVLTQPQEIRFESWQAALSFYKQEKITEEFIPPLQLNSDAIIKDNDGIIFFNYRPDRARQLTRALIDQHFNKFKTQPLSLTFFLTPVSYFDQPLNQILFESPEIKNSLLECLSKAGKTVLALAETEKYAHVTYFFNGGREKAWPGQNRLLIPSLIVHDYSKHPYMSAEKITHALINSLIHNPYDFYLVNYANPDMVGHSGNFAATVKALEFIDEQLNRIYTTAVKKYGGTLIIVADHGKAEEMIDLLGNPKTAHTTNPVNCIIINNDFYQKSPFFELKTLADVAPLILQLMKLPIPEQMCKKN